MSSQIRFMVINYSTTAQSCAVTFSGSNIVPKQCVPNAPEVVISTPTPPIAPPTYTLVVPAGGVCGLIADIGASIVNPQPRLVMIIAGGSKDPWPPPPPRPLMFDSDYDFHIRYNAFLASGATIADEPLAITFGAVPPPVPGAHPQAAHGRHRGP